MNRFARPGILAGALCLAVSLTTAPTRAQTGPVVPQRQEGDPVALSVSAKATEKPALQYALLPKVEETEKGNAAVKYLDAVAEMPQLSDDELNLLSLARDIPLGQLRDDAKLKSILDRFDRSMHLLSEGARLESANWETNTRREGMASLIPSLGKFRELAEVLQVQARLDISEHEWPAAREKLDTGYALARHMGQGETLIESLVGVAIASLMNRSAEEWIAEPGAPNLYWPLTNLPAPFNDMRRPLSFERAFVYFSLPEFKDFKAGRYSRDGWILLVNHFQQIASVTGTPIQVIGGQNLDAWKQEAAGTAFALALYPEAKRFLIERGFTKEQTEAMPTFEAVERYFVRSFDEESDETFKNAGLPTVDAVRGFKAAGTDFESRRGEGGGNILARILLPSLGNVEVIAGRCDRQIAMLRIVEALRAYAADKGSFPATLDALMLPVPLDPTTGKSFEYQLNGGIASIISPNAVPRDAARYDVILRK